MRYDYLGILAVVVFSMWSAGVKAQDPGNTARMGVLAFRGPQAAQASWRSLAEYLTASVAGWRFEIVPVTLVSAREKIKTRQIDFLITNPGHFVDLATDLPLSVLSTRERFVPGQPNGLLTFGTVIFTRNGSGIRTFADLRGKRLAAVSPDAFGGFQVAWDELRRQSMDPFTDLETILFMGFPQDEIVTSVASGQVDAGVVRSGLLESLDAEGQVNIGDFEILNSNAQPEHPFLVTGHLYPEWPFLALPWIDKTLREQVTRALLETQTPGLRQKYDLKDLWSAPLSYESVRQLVAAFQSRNSQPSTRPAWFLGNRALAAFAVGVVLTALLAWAFLLSARRLPVRSASRFSEPGPGEHPGMGETRAKFDSLTRREREILVMICSGKASKTIADDLGISPKTVEFHRANLLQKTKAGTTAHLVQLATRLNFDQGFILGETSK